MVQLQFLRNMMLKSSLWVTRFLVILATFGFSFFPTISSGVPATYKTELHERIRSQVSKRTIPLFPKTNSPVSLGYSLPTNILELMDLSYHHQLKIFDRKNFNPQATTGHHPRICVN